MWLDEDATMAEITKKAYSLVEHWDDLEHSGKPVARKVFRAIVFAHDDLLKEHAKVTEAIRLVKAVFR